MKECGQIQSAIRYKCEFKVFEILDHLEEVSFNQTDKRLHFKKKKTGLYSVWKINESKIDMQSKAKFKYTYF